MGSGDALTLTWLSGMILALAACSAPAPGNAPGHAPCEAAQAPGQPRDPEDPGAAWHSATSRGGSYQVSWRPARGVLPVNEPFELLVWVEAERAPGGPVEGAEIIVQGDMPDHGHGMLREPRSREEAPGLYRVRGMLLHMVGHWTLSIDVLVAGSAEGADFELDL